MNRTDLIKRTAMSAAVVATVAAGIAVGGSSGSSPPPPPPPPPDPYADLPPTINMNGVVRDFRARNAAGGHPDFELSPTAGLGHYVGMVLDQLDADGKPVMAGTGFRVSSEWRDGQGHMISRPRSYIAARQGDVAGNSSGVQGGCLTTSAHFAQWFRDVPGVNMSALVPLELTRRPGTNIYVFDDQVDTHYSHMNGFFCVNGRLLGANDGAQGGNMNYDFTYTIDANFTFRANQGQYFSFSGNDDIWVFIDGKLVVDIGGMHANQLQRIDLDRLSWLVDGQDFNMKMFYAQRNRPYCNLHVETSMALRAVDPPPVTDQFD